MRANSLCFFDMTLITLHSRIHFARDVLEEALRAEVDENRLAHALLLCPVAFCEGEFLSRVESGLSSCAEVTLRVIYPAQSKYDTGAYAREVERSRAVDVIIAFGTMECIAHGRKCRHEIVTSRYRQLAGRRRDPARKTALQPAFFVIPGIEGLPDPCLESTTQSSFKTAPPGVIICDPSVIDAASEVEIARTVAQTMGRCLNVLGAQAFNPLADGLAIDGLARLARMMDDGAPVMAPHDRLRDVMAATLNGALALQKGTGLVEALRFSFGKAVGRELDGALLYRVMLARMLDAAEAPNTAMIARVLGVPPGAGLPEFVAGQMAALPLPGTLQEMDIRWDEVEQAVGFMEPKFGTPQMRSQAQLRQVLQDVY